MFTGSCIRDLLEVAYVRPFPTGGADSPRTALLMRSDVHTLWDLNLIGVEPTTRRVYIAKRLGGTVYEELAGFEEDLAGVSEYDSLPEAVKELVSFIENAAGAPISLVSTGPEREETVSR